MSQVDTRNAVNLTDCTVAVECEDAVEGADYLSAAFLLEVAENALRESNIKLKNIKYSMGSCTGENYCSKIYRIQLTIDGDKDNKGQQRKQNDVFVIVKSIIVNDTLEFIEDLCMFHKEKITYTEMIPRLEMLLDGKERFAPRLYHSLKDPINTLVFEDLKEKGFLMASRESGLDYEHSTIVLKRLAKFHAASMIVQAKMPDLFDSYSCGMLAANGLQNKFLFKFFSNSAEAMMNAVAQWPGYESIHKKLQNYMQNLRENLIYSQLPYPNDLNVLNHGDLWVNNILFKYDKDNHPLDTIFLDFQLSIWGSPGIDLNYFLYTSMQLDILKQKRDELIRIYHETLCQILHEHQHPHIPTYAEIYKEVQQRLLYGFFANYAIFPLISMDKTESVDSNAESYADEEFARAKLQRIYARPRVVDCLKYTLKYFDAQGILDQ